jgi:hypothetical protein
MSRGFLCQVAKRALISTFRAQPQDAANRFKNVVAEKTRGREQHAQRRDEPGSQEKRNDERVTRWRPPLKLDCTAERAQDKF